MGRVNGDTCAVDMTFVVDGTLVVDMTRCTGCQTCRVACRDRAQFPDDVDLLRVEALEGGAYPMPTLAYRIVHCFHCAEPPCADVCPVGAIVGSTDCLVTLDATACTGCGSCIDACPFEAIVMLAEGVVAKCDGCQDEVAQGSNPTCVRACPMRALSLAGRDVRVETQGRVADQSFDHHNVGPAVLFLRKRPR